MEMWHSRESVIKDVYDKYNITPTSPSKVIKWTFKNFWDTVSVVSHVVPPCTTCVTDCITYKSVKNKMTLSEFENNKPYGKGDIVCKKEHMKCGKSCLQYNWYHQIRVSEEKKKD